jgi:hypothetical protein
MKVHLLLYQFYLVRKVSKEKPDLLALLENRVLLDIKEYKDLLDLLVLMVLKDLLEQENPDLLVQLALLVRKV